MWLVLFWWLEIFGNLDYNLYNALVLFLSTMVTTVLKNTGIEGWKEEDKLW